MDILDKSSTVVYKAMVDFPYFVISREMESGQGVYLDQLRKTVINYHNYKNGVVYYPEGTHGDYVPSNVKFKLIKTLIDKESRFMFSQCPDVNVIQDDVTEDNEMIGTYKKIISKIIDRTKFPSSLLSASKDCFVGGRIACCVDFSESTGVGIRFYNCLEFYYETEYDSEELTKFVSFKNVTNAKHSSYPLFLVNRYVKENSFVYMSSVIHKQNGEIVETLIPESKIALDYIPAVVIKNIGLTGDNIGISDCVDIETYEEGINRIGNADIDSERKGMNPVTALIDINHETTKNLSSSAGSVWDLESNQFLNEPHPSVSKIAPELGHVEAVKETISRLRSSAYSQLDIPDISIEGMLSGVTSYKAVRALYFPLSVRCDEKLREWKPALNKVFKMALDMCILNPNETRKIYEVENFDRIRFTIDVVENYALLADEAEEKAQDLEEINLDVRSRLSYLQKWRQEEFKTEEDAEKEIERIAMEKNMMDTTSMNDDVIDKMEKDKIDNDVKEKEEDIEIDKEIEDRLDMNQ